MGARQLINNVALQIGTLAFVAVGALSYAHGVEPLFSVLRGIGAFFASVLVLRAVGEFLNSLAESENLNYNDTGDEAPTDGN